MVAALKSLDAEQPAAAKVSFEKATDEFSQARNLLGPDWFHGVPWIGRQLGAANDLTTIGVEGSVAGAAAADLLIHAGSVTGDDRLSQLLQLARPQLDTALSSLVVVAQRVDGLSTDGLVPQLATAVTDVQQLTEPMELILHRSQAMLDLERYLFSKQHRFLLLSQNSAELRPTGGFMGTYGLIEFGPDGFHLAKYADTFTLPHDTLNLPIPPGGQVNYRHFWVWNTNWWVDFPTSAQTTLKFWENLNQPQVDGVVAIDIPTIRDLLKIFGPISVPESSVPLTAQNVMEQLTYVVEYQMGGPGSDKSKKKNAVVSLAVELLHRITNMKQDQSAPFAETLGTSANEKHIQAFFSDPKAQASMVAIGWSGAIDPPAGTTDLLAVANGVIKPSKANLGVTKSLDYHVALAPDGSAETTLRLGYRKSPKLLQGVPQQWLADYVRAHRAAGTTLSAGKGSNDAEPLDDATGMPTFGHYFRLDPGKSTSVVMRFDVPKALRQGVAVELPGVNIAPADGDTWHYRLLLVKQADLVDTKASITVQVPDGWKVVESTAVWRVSGAPVPTSGGPTEVTIFTPLKQDLILDVTLIRG